ncbi:MAG TPA: hypothetical protein PLI45_01795 [Candidatus Woesebacteria bacterium]|nr:hypothetical protein [Candidatus Woesebacteria bacterium]
MNKILIQMSNLVLYFIFPVILVLYGVFSFTNSIQTGGRGIFYLLSTNNNQSKIDRVGKMMLRGNIAKGEFVSQYNNLGTVFVRFDNKGRDSIDVVIFRIRESGAENWIYSAKYNTDQFQPHELFPFGFPVINDSQGKTYQFEIESQNGEEITGIVIDSEKPVISTKYVFTKEYIYKNINNLTWFLIHKVWNIVADTYLVALFLSSFLPFLLYSIFVYFGRNNYLIFLGICFFTSILEIIVFKDYLMKDSLPVILLWFLTILKFKIDGKVVLVFSIMLLTITSLLSLLNLQNYAEKAAIWSFVLFVISTIVHFLSSNSRKNKKVTVEMLISDLSSRRK